MPIERSLLGPATQVAVYCRFDESWTEGFEIADVDPDSAEPYVIRRQSDGALLPARFGQTEVHAV